MLSKNSRELKVSILNYLFSAIFAIRTFNRYRVIGKLTFKLQLS